jgi:hypothetical protein
VITILLSVGFKEYQNPWLVIAAVTAAGTACGAIFGFVEMSIYKRLKAMFDRFFKAQAIPRVAQTDVAG